MNVAEGWAISFNPTVSATLQDVVLPLMSESVSPALVIAVAADSSGSPGAVISTLTQNGSIPSLPTSALVMFTCNTCAQLQAGTPYWLVAGVATGTTFVDWKVSTAKSSVYFDNTASINGPWSFGGITDAPGFQVDGFIPGPTPQTITLGPIANQILGGSPFAIAAHASSNLPVTLLSNTPQVCKTAGAFLELLTAGSCSISANQAGNGTYSAAPPVIVTVTVSPAKPAGSLLPAPGSPFVAGYYPFAQAVGDFNGDGIPDLAFAIYEGGYVSVLLGNGSGGFSPALNSPFLVASTYTVPVALAVADFNGDGHLDIITLNNSATFSLLTGDGSGGFALAAGSPVALQSYSTSLAVGDFNGDGSPDLAITMASGGLTVLLGNGNGGFTAAPGGTVGTGTRPASVAVGDFNGDGILDIAIGNQLSNNVTVLLGNGSGGFSAAVGSPLAVGNTPMSVAIGDFNGDGNQDLAIANNLSSNVTVLLGNGVGAFIPASGSPFSVPIPNSVAVGDFNGDGYQDLAVANAPNNVTVLLGNGSGGFASPTGRFTTDVSPVSILVADFNGDGIADIATANQIGNNATVLLGGKTPTASALTTSSPPTIDARQSVPLTLTLSELSPAFANPTGTVTFLDGAQTLGTASQAASPFTFSVSHLAAGDHLLKASFSGDVRSLGSTSNTIAVHVTSPCAITPTDTPSTDLPGILNEALGLAAPANDLSADGTVNLVDVQIIMNAVQGLGCSAM
jgi:hypothetical protein